MFPYTTEAAILEVVAGFELCTTSKDGFPHSSHLVVAVWYLHQTDLFGATELMRNGLKRFLKHHEIDEAKYNETITSFWLRLVDQVLRELPQKRSIWQSTNAVLEALNDSLMVFEYYSRERLFSEEARTNWLEPDLRPLHC